MRLRNHPEHSPHAEVPEAAIRQEQVVALTPDEGQRLAAARAEFRAAWEAKRAQKQQAAGRARRAARILNGASLVIILAGLICGSTVGALGWIGAPAPAGGLEGVTFGVLLGVFLAAPLMTAALGLAGVWQRRAVEIERSVREMQQL